MQKFDLCVDLAEHGIQNQFPHGSSGNRPFGQNGRASGQRKTLNNSHKLRVVDGEDCPFVVRDADARRAITLSRWLLLRSWLLGHGSSMATLRRMVQVTSLPWS